MFLNTRYFFAPLFCIVVFCSCATLKPIAPAINAADIPKIEQPVSDIEVPVSADLKNYIKQAETAVPNTFTDKQQPCEGLSYAYTFKRTPFTITGSNNTINLKFVGSYGISASYCAKCSGILGNGTRCIVPTINASCGVDDQAPRRMEIAYRSVIAVQPDYHLKSKTALWPAPKPLDRCNVLLNKIDVTDRLIDYITAPLNNLGVQVDQKIGAFNLKPMVEQLWNNLSAEYKLGDMGFLQVNPQSVRLSNFNLNGSQLNFSVGLSAKPLVTAISNASPVKPLPNLSTYVPANGFNIYLDMVDDYDHITDAVNKQVVGQVIPVAGKEFIVTNTKIYGTGRQIVIAVDFKGSNTGTIYLVGTPTYNTLTRQLSFPDLRFDVQTKNWMIKAASWMFNGKITTAIKEKAVYNCAKLLDDSKANLQKQLSRNLGNNITSEVAIKALTVQDIYPTADKLIVRVLSNGEIKVKVTM